jgi:hypothetical protein
VLTEFEDVILRQNSLCATTTVRSVHLFETVHAVSVSGSHLFKSSSEASSVRSAIPGRGRFGLLLVGDNKNGRHFVVV